ncbi:MAG: DUF4423 domain-containing protein [Bdellovibrionaceae bacterium]|nr:DUF4423 domain-containing protein [Pseudobdellovibrionaceae bacterium]
MEIYLANTYREVIEIWSKQSGRVIGIRSQLASAAACSPSWITRVLSGSVHLTPDQAFGISQFMLLNDNETEYFLLLVDKERASSQAFKKRIDQKLQTLRRTGRQLSSSLKTDTTLTEQGEAVIYYSSWIYPAIHTACMIEGMTFQRLSQILKVQEIVLKNSVSELKKMGILKTHKEFLVATSKSVHLPAEHIMAKTAHLNWRAKTINYFQEGQSDGLHYSAIHCLSQKDFEIIQSQIKEAIMNCRKQIQESKEESLAIFCVDWYLL